MKFTIAFIVLLAVTSSWAKKQKKTEKAKETKREAEVGYPTAGISQAYAPSLGQDANSISIGAGYSVGGGGKPSYNFGSQDVGAALQVSPEGLPGSGHGTIQLAPITLQPSHGSFVGSDISQLMSQLSQGLNSGAITLGPSGGGELNYAQIAGGHVQPQEISAPQYSFAGPKLQLQQYTLSDQQGGPPSYAAGHKGLGSYSTGPVLFNPAADGYSQQPAFTYSAVNPGHPGVDAGNAYSGGQSLAGLSFESLHGPVLGGHSKQQLSGGYQVPSGKHSFKPSAFLGASHGDVSQGQSGLAGQYPFPSFNGYSLAGNGHSLPGHGHAQSGLSGSYGGLSLVPSGHRHTYSGPVGAINGVGSSGSSSKFTGASYLPKPEGYGSLESIAALSSNEHPSPPRTTYGHPSSSSLGAASSSAHAASSINPQYYVASSKHAPSFGHGSTSYKAPSSSHSSLSSYSSGPKYSYSSNPSSRHGSSKDSHGAYSENTYNTIKYSEELKPHPH